jgi:hypothetical protein
MPMMSTLRGQLQSISLVDILQLLHANRKTGELLVSRGRSNGVLYLRAGEVVHAETAKARGEIAAFDILEWDQGSFEYITTAVPVAATIRRSVPDLLMEAARTTDSRRHLSGIFPDLDLVPWPTLREPRLTDGLKIFAEDRPVLAFLDGYRTFREVMADSAAGDVSVLQVCATLLAAGRLSLLAPALPLAAVSAKPGFFQRADQVRLAKSHETRWMAQGPYGDRPIEWVRVAGPGSSTVVLVQFVKGMSDETIGIPRELMQSWDLPEATMLSIRPALRPLTT